jgi:hypothetical protein
LCILWLTTLPILVLRFARLVKRSVPVSCGAMLVISAILFSIIIKSNRGLALFAPASFIFLQHRSDARNVAADQTQPQGIVQLPRRVLKPKVLVLFDQIFQTMLQLRGGQLFDFVHFHKASLFAG